MGSALNPDGAGPSPLLYGPAMHRILVVLVAALALALPDGARAAVVATVDGTALDVGADGRGAVCAVLRTGDDEALASVPDRPACERAPRSPFRPRVLSRRAGGPLGLVLPDDVAAVELAGVRTPTLPVDGAEGRVALVPGAGPDDVLRFLDAGGTLVGAAPTGEVAFGPRAGRVLFRRAGATVRARRGAIFRPDPRQPDRTVPATCFTEVAGTGSGGCLPGGPRGFAPSVTPACAPARALLSAFVPDRVARVRVVFGTGRSETVATRPLPADVGPGRVLASALPRGLAVRSATALDATGRRLVRRRVGAAPSGTRCGRDRDAGPPTATSGPDEPLPAPVAALVPVAAAGGRILAAADGPDRLLCTRLAGERRAGCDEPPVDAGSSDLRRSGRVVAGVLGRDVSVVRLHLDDGRVVRAPAIDDPGYGGVFSGLVRFAAVELPAGRHVVRADARDARGRRLAAVPVREPSRTRRTRRAIGGGLLVERVTTTEAGRTTRSACVGPERQARALPFGAVCGGGGGLRAQLTVRCGPRRAVALGALPPGATGVRLRLAGGRVVVPRLRRVRGVGRLWSAILGPGDAPAALVYAGRLRATRDGPEPTRRVRLRLPAPAAQCGYDAIVF